MLKKLRSALLLLLLLLTTDVLFAQTITSFTPASGPAGTLVTITGTALNSTTAVTINGTSAIVVSKSSSQAVILVMPGTTSGALQLTAVGNVSHGTFTVSTANGTLSPTGTKVIDQIGSRQGTSVAISADGTTAVIGDAGDNTNVGAAYIYVKSGNTWTQQGSKLVGAGASGTSYQGESVAISADGNTVVVGGFGDALSVGAFWVYTRSGTTWSAQGGKMTGSSDGNSAQQGYSVAISADGNTIIAGGPNESSSTGAAWIFTRSGTTWTEKTKLVGTSASGAAKQGYAVAISADGTTVMVGGKDDNSNKGAVWIYTLTSGTWGPAGGTKLSPTVTGSSGSAGSALSLSSDGNTAAIGGVSDDANKGAIWIYTRTGNVWTFQQKLTDPVSGTSRFFGNTVSLSADGNKLIAGERGFNSSQGKSFLFLRTGTTWSTGVATTTNNETGRQHGYSVAMSSNGATALSGASGGSEPVWSYASSSGNADLASLSTSYGGAVSGFVGSTLSHSVLVDVNTTTLSFTATPSDANATVLIQMNGGGYLPSNTVFNLTSINTADVKVTAQDGTIRIYTVEIKRPPSINSFTPSSGPVGSLVTINGTNLTEAANVKFGGISALIVSNTSTKIVAMPMPGSVTGTVSVTASGTVTSGSIFTINTATPPNTQEGNKLTPTDNIGSFPRFGFSLAVSADGNTAIIGGRGDDASKGAAWIYTRSNGIWTQETKIVNNDHTSTGYLAGNSVAINADGTVIVIGVPNYSGGTGAILIYEKASGVWTIRGAKAGLSGSGMGHSVSVSADGKTVASAGASYNTYSGALWVYTRSGNIYLQEGSTILGGVANSFFGLAMAMSADGNTIMVGARVESSNAGSVSIYAKNSGVWSLQNKMMGAGAEQLGMSVALSADGNTAMAGVIVPGAGSGKAYVYTRSSNTWSAQQALSTSTSIGYAGFGVGLNANGNIAIVTAKGDNAEGASWIWTRTGNSWTQRSNFTGTGGNVHQGYSVALSSDGTTALVGTDGASTFLGAAWAFAGYSSDADLSAMTTSSGTLSPVFSSATTSYTASVSNATSSITVTPTRNEMNASIQVRVNGGTYTTVSSGAASGTLSLNVGSNTIDVKVAAQDGTIKTYTIGVTRKNSQTITFSATATATYGDADFMPGASSTSANSIIYGTSNPAVATIISGKIHIVAAGTVTVTADQSSDATYDAATQASQTLTINKANQLITFNALPNKTVSDAAFSLSATGGASGNLVTYVSSNTAVATISGSTVTIAGVGSTNITASQPGNSNYNAASDVMQALTVQSSDANLSNLSLSNGTLSPTFASGTINYTASVSNATSTLTITPTRNQANAIIQLRINGESYSVINSGSASGALSLNVGDNTVEVLVTAQDGITTKTYTTIVTRVSTDANLSALVLSAGTLSPTFAAGTAVYTATVPNTVTAITVTPTKNNAGATIQVQVNGAGYTTVTSGNASGSLALNIGSNTINVRVTAQDGTTIKSYNTTITRSLSADADLSSLVLSAGTLSPVFDPAVINYIATVSNATSTITVTPAKNHANAAISVRVNSGGYANLASGVTSNALALNIGTNLVYVRVAAQDGSTVKEYVTTVTRLSIDANLSALTLSSGALSPTFATGTVTYTASVSNATSSITVTPTKNHAGATIQIRVNGGAYTAINSATASDPLALNVGTNTINVLVTAQDGTTAKTYNVTVTRRSADATLTAMSISSGMLSPTFATGTYAYIATVANSVASITVTSTKNHANATIRARVNGGSYSSYSSGNPSNALALNVGVNTVDVQVTAQDGNTLLYTTAITRLPSTDATLSNFNINGADISPVFVPETTTYNGTVNNATNEITLLPVLNEPNATIQARINGGVYTTITNNSISGVLTLNTTGTSIIEVLVTAQDGVTTRNYTFNITRAVVSAISSINPNIAPIGSLITISGTNLNQATDVKFGGVSGLIISNTATAIVAMPMPGTVTGTVAVTASGTVVSSGMFTVSKAAVPTTQQGALMKPPTAASDSRLGAAVAISADGNTAIAGGPGDDINRGSVFILVRNAGVWTQQTKIFNVSLYGGNYNDYAGVAVAISADGNTIVFGSPLSNSLAGAILVYTRTGSTWTFRSVKTGLANSQMGHSVAISADGKTIVAGNRAYNSNRGAVTSFKRSGNIFLQDGAPILGDVVNSYFGGSIALSADANTMVVGGYFEDSFTGSVKFFARENGIWTQQGNKLSGTNAERFGWSVALNADGNTAIVGAPYNGGTNGKAYVYTREGTSWAEQTSIGITTPIQYVGSSVSLNATGNTAIISAQNTASLDGASWIHTRSGNTWTQGANLVGSNGSRGQGISVSMSADGTTAFVGSDYADNAGAAWAFTGVSADADLSALTLSSGTISPVFNSGTTAYTASVANATTALTIIPYKSDANATIQVQVNGGAYVTVANGTASSSLALNLGPNTINVKVTAQDGTTIKTYSIDVTRRNIQTITFNPTSTATFGDADFFPGATSTSGNAIIYTTSDPAIATIIAGKIHILTAGTVNITADQPQDARYEAATQKIQSLTIDKASQTITFGTLPAVTYGDPELSLSATGGGSGNAISYVSSNTAAATISGNMVTIAGAGTTDITASQAGNGNYNAATDVVQVLTINKATATITLGNLTATYDGTAKAATSTTTPASLNAVSYLYDGSPTAPTNAGTYALVATLSNANYTASQAGNFVIGKANQTITFNTLIHKTVGDPAFNLAATGGGSGIAVTYVSSNTSVATISGSTVTIVGAGTTNITVSQTGNANYNAALDVVQALTIDKATQTITFNALTDKTYGDAAFNLTATGGPSGNTVNYLSSNTAVATISVNTLTIVGTGTIDITASQAGNSDYSAASDVIQSLKINKAMATITLGSLTPIYDGTQKSATATTTPASLGTVSFTYNGTGTAPSNAGTYAVVATLANSNYSATQSGSLVIGKANQTITFNTLANKSFGDGPFNLTAIGGTSGNTVTYVSSNTAVATISGNTVTIVGSGTTDITASQAGNGNYNAAIDAIQTLTIDKGIQTIAFGTLTNKIYGDAAFNLTATGGSSGNTVTYVSSNTSVATVSGNTVTILAVGTTNITASQAGNDNYIAATDAIQTLTVDKANQIITFNPLANKTFGDADFSLTATGGSSGIAIIYVSSDLAVATISGSTVTIVGSGSTTITASQTGNSNYNDAADVHRTLTINNPTKIDQSIVFGVLANKTYGDANFTLNAAGGASPNPVTYTSSNTSVATITSNTVTIIGAGTSTITASQAGNVFYNAAADEIQLLTVNKAIATIVLGSLTPTYDGTAKAASSVTTPASLNNVTYTYDGSSTAPTNAGTYSVIATLNHANYSGTQSGSLIIGKANQAITFNTLPNKNYGDAAFNLTATGGASGNAITYVSSNTAVATILGNTVTIVGAGTTNITASQSGNSNYNPATDAIQGLIIDKANQSITFNALANKTYGNAAFNLMATGGASGSSVTYVSSNSAVATISGNTVTIIGAGTTNITASQGGNANYNAAIDVTNAFNVDKATATIALAGLTPTYDGTPKSATSTTLPASLSTVSYTYNGSATAPSSPGTYAVIATLTNSNYTGTQSGSLVISKADQTITFNALANRTFGDADFSLGATGGSSANTVTYISSNTAVATISGNTVTIVGAGTTNITASQAGNVNYNAALDVVKSLTIDKASQAITFNTLEIGRAHV